MTAIRIARVILHLFAGLWTCATVFPRLDRTERNLRIKRWSAHLLALCRVTVVLESAAGAEPNGPGLIVANHISWLDIFVIDAVEPCRFVAKSDIRGWPLIGRLCADAGTIFISRGRQRDVRRIYQGLVEAIHAGERVAFFPEGTTAAQGELLPFHSNLFEAAIHADARIQPYALRYETGAGALHPAVDFIGDMSFAQSMLTIMRAEPITARLTALPSIPAAGAHRRDLSEAARRSIAGALGMP